MLAMVLDKDGKRDGCRPGNVWRGFCACSQRGDYDKSGRIVQDIPWHGLRSERRAFYLPPAHAPAVQVQLVREMIATL